MTFTVTPRQISGFRNVLISWLIVFLFALLILLCRAYLLYPSLRARYLFHELETLQLGHSTFDDAERLAKKIHVAPYCTCDRSKCEWYKTIDNAWLPRWWRGAGETFAVFFSVQDSTVVRKYTAYGVGVDGSFHPSVVDVEEQEQWGRLHVRVPVQTGWSSTDWYRYYEFKVWMTPKASAEDRRRYTSFNFNCFWKYKGCKDARELLPTADPFPESYFP
jgi:hypothetical protein